MAAMRAHVTPNHLLLQSALSLAGRNWHVFPCVPEGKRPALRGDWQDHAITEPARIRAWWTDVGYNIGVACGPSGLVVIDLDITREAREQCSNESQRPVLPGAAVLEALFDQHGEPYPPPTYTVRTPSGGQHLYYAAPCSPVRNSAGRLGSHIDVRANVGYVIGGGSWNGERAYTVQDGRALMPLPPWIADLLANQPGTATARARRSFRSAEPGTAYGMAALSAETQLVAAALPGTRNDTLNRAAFSLGQLAAAGLLSPQRVASALADAAQRVGLPADEARYTIRSGLIAGARRPRST
jgi:hypothetical protein